MVGQNELQVPMQGFLSFDLSAVPPGAIIKSVELYLSNTVIMGSPFPFLGALNIYNQQYGSSLKPNNYMVIVPRGYLYNWNYNFVATMMPDKPFVSPDFVSAVQNRVDLRDNRFQIRMQFEKYYYYSRSDYTDRQYQNQTSSANYLDVGSGNPILTIRYVLPE
jgi:hypothetical protein